MDMGSTLSPNLSAELSAEEKTALNDYETIIEAGLQTFLAVGEALASIRDQKLYRIKHGSFEDYCRERWHMTRQRAYQLIAASATAQNLSTLVDTTTLNESQLRPLAGLTAQEQRLIWSLLQQTAPSGKITAAHVRAVARVVTDALTTGAIDDGDGGMVAVPAVLQAAITEEAYERLQRQKSYLAAEDRQSRWKRQIEALGRVLGPILGTHVTFEFLPDDAHAIGALQSADSVRLVFYTKEEHHDG